MRPALAGGTPGGGGAAAAARSRGLRFWQGSAGVKGQGEKKPPPFQIPDLADPSVDKKWTLWLGAEKKSVTYSLSRFIDGCFHRS